METSIFLAKVIGLSGAISTLAIILRFRAFTEMEEQASKNPVILYLSGFTFVILGSLLVASHQVWTLDWRMIVTLVGWLLLMKGVLRIFFPELVIKLLTKKNGNHNFMIAEIFVLLLSLYLLYQGFILSYPS